MSTQIDGELGKELFIAQYEALRSEIHQRLDQRQQLLTYTLVGAASFFSVGLQSWASAVTVLCFPVLALFLACAWQQHDGRIGQISVFLRMLENAYLGNLAPGWESYRRSTFTRSSGLVALPARGVFIGTQFLALVIGLARFIESPQALIVFVALVLFDLASIVATFCILKHKRERHAQDNTEVNE